MTHSTAPLAGPRPVVAALPARRALPAPSRARRTPTRSEIARRGRMLGLVKFVLPTLAAGLLVLLVVWPDIEGREGRLSFRRGPALTPESLQVLAPRYQGVDELGRPFTVTARLARQPGQEMILLLDAPQADILGSDGAWIFAESRDGRYDRDAKHLELRGDVRIFHDGGTLFRTEEAGVQLDAGTAEGDRPTEAQGPFGTIAGEGFRMADRGAVMVFTGRARAVLEGRQR